MGKGGGGRSAFSWGIRLLSCEFGLDSQAFCTSIIDALALIAAALTSALRHLIFARKKASRCNHRRRQTEGRLIFNNYPFLPFSHITHRSQRGRWAGIHPQPYPNQQPMGIWRPLCGYADMATAHFSPN